MRDSRRNERIKKLKIVMSSHLVGSVLLGVYALLSSHRVAIFVAPPSHSSVLRGSEELGTLDAPFTTLEAARDALRPSKRQGRRAPGGGDYFWKAHSRLMLAVGDPRRPGLRPHSVSADYWGLEIPATAFTPAKLPSGAPGGVQLFDLSINETRSVG